MLWSEIKYFIKLLLEKNFFGKCVLIPMEWRKREYFLEIEQYRKAIKNDIKFEKREVRLHVFPVDRIGELLPRYYKALQEKHKNEKVLDIFVSKGLPCNKALLKIIKKNICLLDKDDLYEYEKRLWSNINIYKYRDDYMQRVFDIDVDNNFDISNELALDEEDEKLVEVYYKAMNIIKKSFVCISSRESSYLNRIDNTCDWSYHNYRDSNINHCRKAVQFLDLFGIKSVRYGKYVDTNYELDLGNSIIDYSKDFYSDILDLALARDCIFFLTDSNGADALPLFYKTPIAHKNLVPISKVLFSWYPKNEKGLYIFKLYWKREECRYLSVSEMIELENKADVLSANLYDEAGIDVIENSIDEIEDLTIEMKRKLDGEWNRTELVELKNRFNSILKDAMGTPYFEIESDSRGEISELFLERHSDLLW